VDRVSSGSVIDLLQKLSEYRADGNIAAAEHQLYRKGNEEVKRGTITDKVWDG